MAEKCSRKAFRLISSLDAIDRFLEKGKEYTEEASDQVSLAIDTEEELWNQECITEDTHEKLRFRLGLLGSSLLAEETEVAEEEMLDIVEEIKEADLAETAKEGIPPWLKRRRLLES